MSLKSLPEPKPESITMFNYIDIHSHLHFKDYDNDREEVISKMKERGVATIVVGTDYEDSKKAIELANKHENIFACVGIHPNDIGKVSAEGVPASGWDEKLFEELAREKKVVAIGECGLDYFRLKENIEEEKAKQKSLFIKHILLSIKIGKPLMLHGRGTNNSYDAYEDMLEILEKYHKTYGDPPAGEAGKLKGNAHFFAGDISIAERFLNIGFTMSFSGVITFTKDYDDVVHFVPLNMIHAETDSPYATPVPFRGKRNNPFYVEEVVRRIALIREYGEQEVMEELRENCKRVFGI